MSKSATVYYQISISGDNTTQNVGFMNIPVTTITGSPAFHQTESLSSGSNTISIPQLPNPAYYCLIVPSTTSAVNKWLMATSGDTIGMQLFPSLPSLIAVSQSITQFVLRASGTDTVDLYFF